jgi:DNA-binding CsgD family transcriptional regulator
MMPATWGVKSAVELKISAHAVEVYKARVMNKLGVPRVPELVKLVGILTASFGKEAVASP